MQSFTLLLTPMSSYLISTGVCKSNKRTDFKESSAAWKSKTNLATYVSFFNRNQITLPCLEALKISKFRPTRIQVTVNQSNVNQALLNGSKGTGVEVNLRKTKNMLTSLRHKTGLNHCINTAKKSFKEVVEFKYFGKTLTDRNCINEGIKRRLNSGNLATILFSLLSSRLLPRHFKVRI
jgi:hypothetical protein